MTRKLCAVVAGLMLLAPAATQAQELLSIEIVGPAEVWEQTETPYQCIAHFDIGDAHVTTQAEWWIDPAGLASIDDGLLTIEDLAGGVVVLASASYAFGDQDAQASREIVAHASRQLAKLLPDDGAAGDASADFDGNGVIDTRDFIAYLNLWAGGC